MQSINVIVTKKSITETVRFYSDQLDNDKSYELIIRDKHRSRTLDQNDHFHGHIRQIVQETGNDFEQMKIEALLLACQYYNYPYIWVHGVMYPKSTADRTTMEMHDAIEGVHMLAYRAEIILIEKEW